MAYIKTLRKMHYENNAVIYGVEPGRILTYAGLYEYNSDGLSPSTYPIIEMTLGEEIYYFEKEEVIKATLVEEVSPISVEIPASVLDFSIYTDEEDFSMFSTDTQDLLAERFPVMLYEQIDDSRIFLGKYYLSKWKNSSENIFKFIAQNIIGVLAETEFDGIYWDAATTLEDIFAEILVPIDVDYVLHADLLAVELSGWIAPGDYRKALQQICFAGGAYVTAVGSTSLLINPVNLPITTSWDFDIPDDDKTAEQDVDLLPLVTGLELVSHDFVASEDLEDIYEQELEAGNYKIIFEKPYYDLVVSGPGYTPDILTTEDDTYELVTEDAAYTFEAGGEYVFGPNVLYLTLAEQGTVTITGYPWIDSTQGYSWTEDDIVQGTNKNILRVTEASLVNSSIAEDVLDRMIEYYRLRYKQEMGIFYYLRVCPQDNILTSTYYGLALVGVIQRVSSDLTAGFIQKIELVGNQR